MDLGSAEVMVICMGAARDLEPNTTTRVEYFAQSRKLSVLSC